MSKKISKNTNTKKSATAKADKAKTYSFGQRAVHGLKVGGVAGIIAFVVLIIFAFSDIKNLEDFFSILGMSAIAFVFFFILGAISLGQKFEVNNKNSKSLYDHNNSLRTNPGYKHLSSNIHHRH